MAGRQRGKKRSANSDLASHYAVAGEDTRLTSGPGALELARTLEILRRHLPPPPAVVLDVGGGPGTYSCHLAREGYTVHLIDPVTLHVEQARRASQAQPQHPLAGTAVGDARRLKQDDEMADAVLLFGPLYHLTRREDRLAALRESYRVLVPGGRLFAAVISRFASVLDGIGRELLRDGAFQAIVNRDLANGQHRNPTGKLEYFTTAYFHHPEEIDGELEEAGFIDRETLAIEGPAWLLPDLDARLVDPDRRRCLLQGLRSIEREPTLRGVSAHLLAIGRRARP